jgi:hypothetical protein
MSICYGLLWSLWFALLFGCIARRASVKVTAALLLRSSALVQTIVDIIKINSNRAFERSYKHETYNVHAHSRLSSSH